MNKFDIESYLNSKRNIINLSWGLHRYKPTKLTPWHLENSHMVNSWLLSISIAINNSTLVLFIMEIWQSWGYLENEILVRKRRKICITCTHFRYSTTSSCVTMLTCPFHQKLIPQGDHLVKGCRYWRENSRIFAPEAAW